MLPARCMNPACRNMLVKTVTGSRWAGIIVQRIVDAGVDIAWRTKQTMLAAMNA